MLECARLSAMSSRDAFADIPSWTKFYQPGTPTQIQLPTESLAEMFERVSRQGGRKTATVFFGAKMSYRQFGKQVACVAAGLRSVGVRAGDRVAILLPNCPQHLVAMYAAWRLGAIIVEHNPTYTADELSTMFGDHGARVAIAMDSTLKTLKKMPKRVRPNVIISVNLLKAMPKSKQLVLSLPLPKLRKLRSALTSGDIGTLTWEELLASKPIGRNVPKPRVDDLAAIQYTSGTTGKPKGAMLTHFNLYSNALQGAAWMNEARNGKETSYAALPIFHAFGVTVHGTFGVLKQMRQVMFPKPEVSLMLDSLKKYPPTNMCAVPLIFDRLAEGAKERGLDLSTCKWCISGAMVLPESSRKLWEEVTGGLLVEGYGLTEAAPVALGNPFWGPTRKPGTIGIPFPSTLMKVVDDDGQEVAQGEVGELMLKGPQITKGYWRNPEETALVIEDGWLHTGDMVTQDEDGFVTIVDRKKEIIITGGFNVSPTEVEEVLLNHPAIDDVAVVGVKQSRGDEQVVAAVILKGGATIDQEEVRKWTKQYLTAYKVPRRFVVVDDLPRSMLGKVMRGQVREQLALEL